MIRRLARIFLIVVLLLGGGVAGAFGLAQTAAGQRWLAGQFAAVLAAPNGTPADVEGLSGFLPFDIRLAKLTLPDDEGVWLRAHDLRFAWSPRALFGGRLQIDRVSVETIEVARLPVAAEDPAPEPEEPFTPPQLPTSLPPIEIRTLAVDALHLGEPVLGQKATFRVTGDLAGIDDGNTILLDLSAERTDQPTASLIVSGRADLVRSVLSLDVRGEETGGLLRAVSGEPGAGDLRLSLAGEGPLEAWTGHLILGADGLLAAEATLELGLTKEPRIGLAGQLRPSPGLVPAEVAPLIGEEVEVAFQVTQTEAGLLALEGLKVAADAFEIDGKAALDLDSEDVDADLRLALSELGRFERLAGVPLAGKVTARLTAAGPLLQPEGQIQLQAFDLEAAGITGKSLQTEIDFEVLQPLDQGEPAVTLSGSGGLDQLDLGPDVPNLTNGVSWDFAANAPPEGELRLDHFRIVTDVLTFDASAAVDRATFAGKAKADLAVADLRPITAGYGQEIGGDLTLGVDADLAPHLETIEIEIDGDLDQLASLPPGFEDLLGERLTLKGRGEVEPAGIARLESLSLEAKAVSLGASADVVLETEALTGKVTLALPRLAALETLAETNLAGGLTAEATLGGTVSAPTVRLQATGENLAAAGEVLGRLALAVDAEGLTATPAGSFSLALQRADLEAALQSGFRLDGDTLDLSGLELDLAEARLTGDLTVDLARTLVDGKLEGRVRDLRTLEPLVGVALRGELRLDAELQPSHGQQQAALTLDGTDLRGPYGRLERIRARATVDDALGTPALDATLDLGRLAVDEDIRVDRANVRATGGLDALRIEADLDGQTIEAIELETVAEVAIGDAIEVVITRLQGRFADIPLVLARPAKVRSRGDALALQDLDLSFGNMRLTGRADLAPGRSSLEADLEDLPLDLLATFGAPELEGTARAEVRIQGPSNQPEGRLTVSVTGLRPVGPELAAAPPADLDLNATIGGDRLAATLTMSGVTEQPVEAEGELPFALRMAPLDLQIPPDGRVSGTLNLDLQLARIAAIVGLDDQRLEGLLTGDLRVAGTVAEPEVAGEVALNKGVYENGATGTVLNQIVADIQIRKDAVRIQRFTATDGGAGRLKIEGGANLEADGKTAVDVELAVNEATLVRRDDATGTISGTISVEGDPAARLDVLGRLTVDRAVISIDENPGPSIANLEVEEVGGGAPPQDEEAAGPTVPITIGLDVKTNIPGRVFVRGRGLESEWEGNLAVEGTAETPRLIGFLQIIRGRFDFVGKRFTIDRGRIDFAGGVPPTPTLDLQASAQGRNIKGIISLSGPATDPRLGLSSEPPLPEDEVVAQLLFDKSASELGPGDAIALAQTVSAIRGGESRFDILGTTRDVLGVDTLDVGSGDNPSDVNVTAGKYLTDDVYVEVEQGTGNRSGRASVEVEILPDLVPNLGVEAETTAEGRGGVGLNWHLDY